MPRTTLARDFEGTEEKDEDQWATDGRARMVDDRLLPARARTALPAVPRGTTLFRAGHAHARWLHRRSLHAVPQRTAGLTGARDIVARRR